MKKIIALLSALLLALSLSACDGKGGKACVFAQTGSSYSQGLAKNFAEAFEQLGGTAVTVPITPDAADLTEALRKAVELHADVIFAPVSVPAAEILLQSAKEAGVTCPILAGDTWESDAVLDAARGAPFEVYCSTFFDENAASGKAFVSGFKAWLGEDEERLAANGGELVTAFSALGCDGYGLALAAIRTAAEWKGAALTSADVAAALRTLSADGAATGAIRFDVNGDAIRNSAYIKKADGNAFSFVKEQTVSNETEPAGPAAYDAPAGAAPDLSHGRIRIGVYEALTGENGQGGTQELLGIRYAHSLDHTVTIDGKDCEVELIVCDNGSLEENAVAAATQIAESGALIALGSYGSGVSIAAAPTFEAAQIPVIGLSCTAPAVTEGHSFYFRICFLDPFQGSVMAQFAHDLIEK